MLSDSDSQPPRRRVGYPQRLLAVALLLVGCSTLLGVEDTRVQGTCTTKAECAPGFDCLLGACRDQCASDQECGDGARCLKAIGTSACIPTNADCGESCPEGTKCVGQVCRSQCSSNGDCAGGQECQSGVCVGTDKVHDSPLSTGGAGGATASGGVAGSGMSAAGAAEPGGAGGAGGTETSPVCVPGTKRCAELVIETCISDVWTPTGDCPFACDKGACTGECVPQTKGCETLVPRTCGDDAKWQNGTACAKVCEKGECVDRCTEGTLQCSAGDLTQCADGAFALKEDCAVDCVNQHCTECTAPAEDCKNGQHRTCGADGKWGTPFTCAFMCVGTDCGVCTPNAKPTECIDNTPQYCDDTGNFKPAGAACTGATPLCEDGKCVECAKTTVDCLDANTPRSCQAGKWTDGTDCKNPTPACLKGACVACAPGAMGCLDTNTPRSCDQNGAWKNGTDCAGACLSGSCVECAPNATPTHCANTCTKTRQYCSPQGAWTNYASSCTDPDICSSGSCSVAANEQVGQYAQLSTFSDGLADNLVANRIQITCASDLLGLGARFKTAAGSVRFALYKDVAGEPTSIVAGSSTVVVSAGLTEAPTTAIKLAAGYYWVAMNLSSQLAALYSEDSGQPPATRYASYLFSNVGFPPVDFPAPTVLANRYNLYAVVRRDP
jgi:hypothetical protein